MKTNIHLQKLISNLKKQGSEQNAAIWKRIAKDLEKPTKKRRVVNISKLSKFVSDGETIIVPGKVLGSGDLSIKFTIAAYNYSDEAKRKLTETKCTVMTIDELVKTNPKGKNVRIIG